MVLALEQSRVKAYYGRLLKECTRTKSLPQGKLIHAQILSSLSPPIASGAFLCNALVLMYARCSTLRDAQNLFRRMASPDLPCWTALVQGYTKAGDGETALSLFCQMQRAGVEPDRVALMSALKACSVLADLEQGKQIHALVKRVDDRFESDVFMGTTLVDMYAKCGSIKDARVVFESLRVRNVVTWNAIITGYSQHGQGLEALAMSRRMLLEGFNPDEVTFIGILKACVNLVDLEEGKKTHAKIKNSGFESNPIVGSTLIDMYAKCGDIEAARKVFNELHHRNIVSWNVMVSGYVYNGHGKSALELVEKMRCVGVNPDRVTFISILKACADVKEGKQIHAWLKKNKVVSDVFVASALVDMYAKCGHIEEAWKVFDGICRRDVVLWSAMIAGYVQQGDGKRALALFEEMQKESITTMIMPDSIVFNSVLKACAILGDLEQGKQIHSCIKKKGLECHSENSLIDMYVKCGSMEDAEQVFIGMCSQDVVAWNTMIAGYAKGPHKEAGLKLFWRMQRENVEADDITFTAVLKACLDFDEGKEIHACIKKSRFASDMFVNSSLVDMYAKCGSMEDARQVFDVMQEQKSVVTWNAMIAGYTQHGHGMEALSLSQQMHKEGINPDNVTFMSVLKACSKVGALEQGKLVHASIKKNGLFDSDEFLTSSLVDMYANCGSIEDAWHMFNRGSWNQNVASWNAMIVGYGQHGYRKEGFAVFRQMQEQGVMPDECTFVSVLSLCSHEGLLSEAGNVFHSIIREHGMTPSVEHYTCMIDLLARFGHLLEAEDFINKMPIQPTPVIWMALLAASKIHDNMEIGRRAFQHAMELGLEADDATVITNII